MNSALHVQGMKYYGTRSPARLQSYNYFAVRRTILSAMFDHFLWGNKGASTKKRRKCRNLFPLVIFREKGSSRLPATDKSRVALSICTQALCAVVSRCNV